MTLSLFFHNNLQPAGFGDTAWGVIGADVLPFFVTSRAVGTAVGTLRWRFAITPAPFIADLDTDTQFALVSTGGTMPAYIAALSDFLDKIPITVQVKERVRIVDVRTVADLNT